jgi:hypothetical protein
VEVPKSSNSYGRLAWWLSGLAVVSGLVYLMATANTGPADPTEATKPMSHATVVFNSGMIVFREGLEAILIFAAVTASFLGANKKKRRPVVAGAAVAFGATVVTWFVVQAVLDAASPLGPKLEAITGFIAIVVLLVVLNWFVHRVYWTDWIGRHHRRRQRLLTQTGLAAVIGLVVLGFTTVYREGFEVVLFLQNLQLQNGTSTVLEGVAIGLACTAAVWRPHLLATPQAALPAHAGHDRRPGRGSADGDHRRHRPLLHGPRLDPQPPDAVQRPHLDGNLVRDLPVLGDDRRPDPRRLPGRRLLRAS